ncbi:ComEC/Rec2 family competence protein [Tenacibaculum sp. UWU-22]|uniref:ComEC/Rec2 family competence protein n=1 Tax=Tenacibaculum sp. UWU-22 TaxID=3234187 RepID=UPI0034DB4E9E
MKKLLHYLPFYLLLCLITGICIQFYTNIWQFSFFESIVIFTASILVLIVLHRFNKPFLFSICSFLLVILLGVFTVYIQDARLSKNYYTHYVQPNSIDVLVINKVLKSGPYYNKYKVTVSQVNEHLTTGKLLLNIKKDSLQPPLEIANQIVVNSTIQTLNPPLNPHQFNYKEYLAKQGVYQQIFIDKEPFKILAKKRVSFMGQVASVRKKIQQALKKYHFKNNEYAIINALLLGQRQDVSKTLLENYTKAGAIHILAISGLHIGIILWVLLFLFKPLDRYRNGVVLKTILIIVLLWLFAFLAGLTASVVRAVTMFTFIAIGQGFKRKKNIVYSLIASMFILLLVKPMFLFDVGFQLSYLAVFGIVWVQPLLYAIYTPKLKVSNKLWQLFTVSLAAQAGILPITLYYFHQFPSLFVLSNLVIIPFLEVVLFGGILIIILALLQLLPQFLATVYEFVIYLINSFVSWISLHESFVFKDISMSIYEMLAWYLVIILAIQFFIEQLPVKLYRFLGAIILLQIVLITEQYYVVNKHELIVFNKNRKSIIGVRNGKELNVFSNIDSSTIQHEKVLRSYKIGENVRLKYNFTIPNIFQFKKMKILVVDSLGIYNVKSLKNTFVILRQSPKINLKRLFDTLHPTKIIADGSNFKSYVNRWQIVCNKQKTPFYYTSKKGAFILK